MLLTDLTNNKKIELKNALYIISTPIGNRYDITLRAIYILTNSNVIVCEDTRVTKNLFRLLNIKISNKNWISYNDHNGHFKIRRIINDINNNKVVSFVSDAGTPLLSDPGYKLVQEALKNKIQIISIPGPSAITASIVVSGAKTDKFLFLGFIARKTGLSKEEISRRQQRKNKALEPSTTWICLALIAREQGLEMKDIIAALSTF